MYIRRNYREPFFRGRRKHGPNWRLFLLLTLLLIGGFALWQPAALRTTAYTLIGMGPTATPLPGALASQALTRYQAGDMAGAVDLLEQAVAQRPQNVAYLYELGRILLDMDDPDRALDLAEQITDVAPDDVRGFALRSRALVWKDDPAGAIPVGLAGLQIDPNFAPLYATLSRAYTNKDEWRDGLDYGELAIEVGTNDMHSYWAYAHALREVGAFDEAIAMLERAIDLQPTFLAPYFELAFLYLSLNRDQEAIDTYDLILGMQPRNARALLRQCEAYRKVGEFNRALGLCQDAVNADPSFIPAQYRLGLLRYNDYRFEEARDAFQTCSTAEPDNLECRFRLGLSWYYMARNAVQDCSADPTNLACTTEAYTSGCENAWTILQESLLMAQAQGSSADYAVDIIREGLTAISNDSACPTYSGRTLTLPDAESTAEAVPEATAEPGADG